MSRYIDADKLIEEMQRCSYETWSKDVNRAWWSQAVTVKDNIVHCIQSQPTADVVEVRHGEWAFEVKHFFNDYGDLNVYAKGYCSECGKDYPFNATIASEYVERPDNLIGYEHWDIDVEPIKAQVSHMAKTNKNLYPFCPYCGAKMDGERKEQ